MQLFKKEEINKKRHDSNRELAIKNERLISSLKKTLKLQNDIDFDAAKAKKVKDYLIWCEDLQAKQSKELSNFKAYQKLVEEKKEEYYKLIEIKDSLEDKILTLKEEVGRLDLQVKWKLEILNKSHA